MTERYGTQVRFTAQPGRFDELAALPLLATEPEATELRPVGGKGL